MSSQFRSRDIYQRPTCLLLMFDACEQCTITFSGLRGALGVLLLDSAVSVHM